MDTVTGRMLYECGSAQPSIETMETLYVDVIYFFVVVKS
jgi:hypothetical protein